MFDSTKLRGFLNQVKVPQVNLPGSFGYKGTSEETANFAQLEENDYDSTEYRTGPEPRQLRQPRSTSVGSIRSGNSEGPDMGDDPYGYQQQRRKPEGFDGIVDEAIPEEDEEAGAEGGGKNKISHWQAGWNVTNAIQVRRNHMYLLQADS